VVLSRAVQNAPWLWDQISGANRKLSFRFTVFARPSPASLTEEWQRITREIGEGTSRERGCRAHRQRAYSFPALPQAWRNIEFHLNPAALTGAYCPTHPRQTPSRSSAKRFSRGGVMPPIPRAGSLHQRSRTTARPGRLEKELLASKRSSACCRPGLIIPVKPRRRTTHHAANITTDSLPLPLNSMRSL